MPDIILNFENHYGILMVVWGLLPILFLYKARLSFSKAVYSCSLENSRQLQGVFILVVIVHHIAQRLEADVLTAFKGVGYLSVGVFFILSGYGLSKSLQKRTDYLKNFIPNKIFTLLLPFFLVNFFTVLLLWLLGIELTDFAKKMFSLNLVDTTLWFVVSIFLFYLFFYVSFKVRVDLMSFFFLFSLFFIYIFACKYFNLKVWVYLSSLCFPVGAMLGFYETRLSSLFSLTQCKVVLFVFSLAASCYILIFQESFLLTLLMLKCLIFSVSILILFSFVSLKSRFARFFGDNSLEVYLLHMKLLLIFSFFSELNSAVWMLCYLITLSVAAYYFNKFNSYSGLILRNFLR